MPKKLIIADSAGVCFGVEKAVSSAEDILDGNKHVDVKSFGPLIHNPQTVDILKKKGLSVINKIVAMLIKIKLNDCVTEINRFLLIQSAKDPPNNMAGI